MCVCAARETETESETEMETETGLGQRDGETERQRQRRRRRQRLRQRHRGIEALTTDHGPRRTDDGGRTTDPAGWQAQGCSFVTAGLGLASRRSPWRRCSCSKKQGRLTGQCGGRRPSTSALMRAICGLYVGKLFSRGVAGAGFRHRCFLYQAVSGGCTLLRQGLVKLSPGL